MRAGKSPIREWLLATINLLKPRARSLKDFATSFQRVLQPTPSSPIPPQVEKFLQGERIHQACWSNWANVTQRGPKTFTRPDRERLLRDFAAEKEMKAGAPINQHRRRPDQPGIAPSLFAVMMALGKDRPVARLKATQKLAVQV